MKLAEIFAIALSLSADAFSVCVAAGAQMKKSEIVRYIRLPVSFGSFQFLMPLAGFYGGLLFESLIKRFDHWIAFGLLFIIGLNMLREGFSKKEDRHIDPTALLSLLLLSVATSIDATAVGFSFAALDIPVLYPAAITGAVCSGCSALGLAAGKKLGALLGTKACVAGGIILIGIGVKILMEHLSV